MISVTANTSKQRNRPMLLRKGGFPLRKMVDDMICVTLNVWNYNRHSGFYKFELRFNLLYLDACRGYNC